jgi:CelD/BcsL family acetyltransferase involved in cellulose biosynthesis
MLQPFHLEEAEDLDSLEAEWRELAERSRNLFATWEWAVIWWQHFGAGNRLLLRACRDNDGRLIVVLPLCFSQRGPLRLLRFLGHGPADWMGPIFAPGDEEVARRALQRLLTTTTGWDLLLAEHLPADQGWSDWLRGRVLRREGSPVLWFRDRDWEDFLAGRSANFRQELRRRERRLRRGRSIEYRLCDDRARLDDDLTTLFRLHNARWAGRDSDALAGRPMAFHRAFAHAALQRGWLRLWALEANGVPVAMWYGFRFGGCEWYYQAGRDPEWDRLSVGTVLLAHTVRAALESGAVAYRFLRGGEDYKLRFTDEDPGVETFAISAGPRGAVALSLARLASSLPAPVRGRITTMRNIS